MSVIKINIVHVIDEYFESSCKYDSLSRFVNFRWVCEVVRRDEPSSLSGATQGNVAAVRHDCRTQATVLRSGWGMK